MALEIKELKVKIDVVDKPKFSSSTKSNLNLDTKKLKKEIIAECVAKMSEMLAEKFER